MRPSPRQQQPPQSQWGQPPLATSMYVEPSQAKMPPPIACARRLTWTALQEFCKDSTLPVCNVRPRPAKRDLPGTASAVHSRLTDYTRSQLLSSPDHDQNGPWGGCQLTGIPLSGGRHLGNLGSIILCGVAIAAAAFMVLKSEKKRAAVGRRYVCSARCILGRKPTDAAVTQGNAIVPPLLHRRQHMRNLLSRRLSAQQICSTGMPDPVPPFPRSSALDC